MAIFNFFRKKGSEKRRNVPDQRILSQLPLIDGYLNIRYGNNPPPDLDWEKEAKELLDFLDAHTPTGMSVEKLLFAKLLFEFIHTKKKGSI
jgi:hypothetical protein